MPPGRLVFLPAASAALTEPGPAVVFSISVPGDRRRLCFRFALDLAVDAAGRRRRSCMRLNLTIAPGLRINEYDGAVRAVKQACCPERTRSVAVDDRTVACGAAHAASAGVEVALANRRAPTVQSLSMPWQVACCAEMALTPRSLAALPALARALVGADRRRDSARRPPPFLFGEKERKQRKALANSCHVMLRDFDGHHAVLTRLRRRLGQGFDLVGACRRWAPGRPS